MLVFRSCKSCLHEPKPLSFKPHVQPFLVLCTYVCHPFVQLIIYSYKRIDVTCTADDSFTQHMHTQLRIYKTRNLVVNANVRALRANMFGVSLARAHASLPSDNATKTTTATDGRTVGRTDFVVLLITVQRFVRTRARFIVNTRALQALPQSEVMI